MTDRGTKLKLVQQLIGEVMRINFDIDKHFCELFMDYHLIDVQYYGAGSVGDEEGEFRIKLNRDTFGDDIDECIDYLKTK